VKREIGVPAEEKVGLVVFPAPKTLWESFFGGEGVRVLAGRAQRAPGRLGRLLAVERLMEAMRREPVLALDPALWLAL